MSWKIGAQFFAAAVGALALAQNVFGWKWIPVMVSDNSRFYREK